jgi:ABC-type antimicrobial peptide transport system ATPase subunit
LTVRLRKSTLGRMIAGLLQPSGGQVLFGRDRRLAGADTSRAARGKMIFQDPFLANPRKRIEASSARRWCTIAAQRAKQPNSCAKC